MKIVKYALLTLLIAVITDIAIVLAYASPPSYNLIPTLIKNNSQYTPWLTKNVEKVQKYKNISSITPMTNPCTNCKIATSLTGSNTIFSKMGEMKNFNELSYFAADYRIMIKRSDITAFNTYHSGTWYVNS